MAATQLAPSFAPHYVQTTLDPTADQISQQLEAQRQAQLAQMLTAQGAAPIDAGAGRISPFQGLAKMLQSYEGKRAADKSKEAQIASALASQKQFDSMFPANQPTTIGADPTTMPTQPNGGRAGSLASGLGAPDVTQGASGTGMPPVDASAPAMPSPQAASAPSSAPQTPTAAAQPTNAAPAAPPAVSPMAAATHAAVGAVPSLTGDAGLDRTMAMQMGVPKYFEALAKRYDWTDQQKNDYAVGITGAMRKGMDIATAYKGAVVPGSSSVISADDQGRISAAPVPGLLNDTAATSAATEAGKQSQTPHEVKNAAGQPTFVYATPPAVSGPGGAGGMRTGGEGGNLQTTAGAATQEAMGKNAVELNTQITGDADTAVQGQRTISEMGNLLQGFNPGKMAPALSAIGSVAQAFGVPQSTVEQYTNMNVGDTEAFQKGSAALASEMAKQMTSRVTQQEFKIYLQNNPNWMMTPQGIARAMDYANKGFQQKIEKQQQWQAYTQTHPDSSRWSIDFPAFYNKQEQARVTAGRYNSAPAAQTPYQSRTPQAGSGAAQAAAEGTIISNGRESRIKKNGQWVPLSNVPIPQVPGAPIPNMPNAQ